MDPASKAPNPDPEKLARLWDIGSDVHVGSTDEACDSDERYTELLSDWLARQLPPSLVETQDLESLLPAVLRQLCRELRPFSGDSIGLLLTDFRTDVQVLRTIKDYAKEVGEVATDKLERDAALAIYFAAIASARVFHNAHISQHSDKKLQSAFATLGKRDSVPVELRSLFQKACRKEEKESGTSRKGRNPQ